MIKAILICGFIGTCVVGYAMLNIIPTIMGFAH